MEVALGTSLQRCVNQIQMAFTTKATRNLDLGHHLTQEEADRVCSEWTSPCQG